ncbi:MAG: MBOAT family protein [Clostridiales Family XIII bacterium]|jgi:D-alanyl-lipoteichoic acid acyltransferase DltB (MBOAT superfamily)|nr:MBOAT family protein [Clostridiales Family XIII bacterium]
MLFNSWAFAAFLPIAFVLHWALPHRCRWAFLLAASYFFYMSWNVKYVALILVTTAASYACALWMDSGRRTRAQKRRGLAACMCVCLGILALFKYSGFVLQNAAAAMRLLSVPAHEHTLGLLLPVGISFYTFQTLGYLIDVYRGELRAERHFGIYALYVSYFPQLVAGPIERAGNLIPRLRAERRFSGPEAAYGLRLMAVGYFKKMVVAASMAKYVDLVYGDAGAYTGFPLLLATGFFAFQIYGDFSGYSDIARGASRLMGVDIMQNFDAPYLSRSFREFWSRWHVSLSTWFRDYVYIPLGGSRCGRWRYRRNVMATFLLSGLWHGAGWTFVAWGGLHGIYLAAEDALGRLLPAPPREARGAAALAAASGRVLLTFLLACFAWVFFRARGMGEAAYVVSHMFEGISSPAAYVSQGLAAMGMYEVLLLYLAIQLALLALYDILSRRGDLLEKAGRLGLPAQCAVHVAGLLLILLLSDKGMPAEFIYFQF